jgi:hypothetical protein
MVLRAELSLDDIHDVFPSARFMPQTSSYLTVAGLRRVACQPVRAVFSFVPGTDEHMRVSLHSELRRV